MTMRRSRGRGGSGHSHNNGHNGGNNNRRPGGGSGGGVPSRHQVFDSNGPEVRIRGNAFQVYDKYQALARDAQASGDRVKAENYLQHAEHYYRIILAIQEATGELMVQQPAGEMTAQPADPAQMPQPSLEPIDLSAPAPAAAVA